ncbi:hypothetical protein COCSADRAFT_141976 [Bipolaris sorokiniana ND90Pr]|uniref:AGC-kinase C-terminal domain-containing protein n=1 Tax=Cochliobolus sativus (strain ND90Pr / ATCC 201652) TaxID=665912 RepID=M2T4P6_COCSN|nr:uncharacterized protein COCSADRAFT_141976 [Bipolaris sorokiniana ND90Pr]EMD63972.1 hypothetical protein COCSADRAFT_141976 [Bipolaris sorokiniana ND90Pr]
MDEDIPESIPEGLAEPRSVEIPAGFTPEEWETITEGFDCEQDEINNIIAERGSSGSQKGRPTGLTVPFKGQLSSSSRAIAQRDRAALRTQEEKALEKAKDSDRSAKHHLHKKVKASKDYNELPEIAKAQFLVDKEERLLEQRFSEKRSAEWLEQAFRMAHKKWSKIQNEIDKRRHKKTLHRVQEASKSSSSQPRQSRSTTRLFASGGALEKLLRDEYQNGLHKLENNSFESKQEKDEWQAFVEALSPDELALVTDSQWEKREPTPIHDQFDPDIELADNKPYIEGYGSDECEEEVDDEDEEDFNGTSDYLTDEQWEDLKAQGAEQDEEDDRFQDQEESEFEGFSDDDEA